MLHWNLSVLVSRPILDQTGRPLCHLSGIAFPSLILAQLFLKDFLVVLILRSMSPGNINSQQKKRTPIHNTSLIDMVPYFLNKTIEHITPQNFSVIYVWQSRNTIWMLKNWHPDILIIYRNSRTMYLIRTDTQNLRHVIVLII